MAKKFTTSGAIIIIISFSLLFLNRQINFDPALWRFYHKKGDASLCIKMIEDNISEMDNMLSSKESIFFHFGLPDTKSEKRNVYFYHLGRKRFFDFDFSQWKLMIWSSDGKNYNWKLIPD